MEQKGFTLINRGMNRDLSVSKTGESSAYENHNIRITVRDNDTLLSVTNERGNKKIPLYGIVGELIGWNTLNNYIVLFCHDENVDYIYRIEYKGGDDFKLTVLFHGNLGFSTENPIESIVHFETENIQKIYWVDGIHVLRFMNFVDEDMIAANWNNDPTIFDSNRTTSFGVNVNITKDNTGNTRANGVAQYFLTYFNKHGQETGFIWSSSLVYLSPTDRGGAADETNNNKVTISFSNLDTRFGYFHVYCTFRSSFNGETIAYLVGEAKTGSETIEIVDDGAHLTLIDSSSLLYLGSQPVCAGTITHKDETLFLGDLKSIGHQGYDAIDSAVKLMYDQSTGISNCIEFIYSNDEIDEIKDIKYVADGGNYPYVNQLQYTSSEISTFKGEEKYRFGLKFQLGDGTSTQAFWIGDAINHKYPKIDEDNQKIKRVVAKCTIPPSVIDVLTSSSLKPEIKTVQLVMAEASSADRSVKAQGIVNPTMFNTWERYNERLYSQASWIARPRNSKYANHHFESTYRSTLSTGEIACNYWSDSVQFKRPVFQYQNYSDPETRSYVEQFDGIEDYDFYMYVFMMNYWYEFWQFENILAANAYVVTAKILPGGNEQELLSLDIPLNDLSTWEIINGKPLTYRKTINQYYIITLYDPIGGCVQSNFHGDAGVESYNSIKAQMAQYGFIMDFSVDIWDEWFASISADDSYNYFNIQNRLVKYTSLNDAANYVDETTQLPDTSRWIPFSVVESTSHDGEPNISRFKQHLMFVDENVVTLNSPEIEYDAISFDNAEYDFRIVGVAKMSSVITDYDIDATPGKYIQTGNVMDVGFSRNVKNGSIAGLITWPLWKDDGIVLADETPSEDENSQVITPIPDEEDRTSNDYKRSGKAVYYWLHLWGRLGNITAYKNTNDESSDKDDKDYSVLQKKRVANLRASYKTIYGNLLQLETSDKFYLRQFNYVASQYLQLGIDDKIKYYDGIMQQLLTVPGALKYPVLYSTDMPSSSSNSIQIDIEMRTEEEKENMPFLFVADPVQIEYFSNPHAVISLKSGMKNGKYTQTILPYILNSDIITPFQHTDSVTGWLIPWIDCSGVVGSDYPYIDYDIEQVEYRIPEIQDGDEYLFIGEIYQDFTANDTRYGGTSESAIQNCRFIPAGPQYVLGGLDRNNATVYANDGDTYFQRWDCVKTLPYSEDSVYGLVDITSVMLETHINLDGRTDKYRGSAKLTSFDYTKFGSINNVYSQNNNFSVVRDLDEDYNTDAYRSSLTWSLPKSDSATVDEWSHITLASNLKLDGDKGICRALRRFKNSIIAFQDKGISEVLFNSRTQLSTQDGVPVEIGNSGKVDGKRYLSNEFGCLNKWSVVEGHNGLYFVDNINKAFCVARFSENGKLSISNISTKLGFSTWFRKNNSIEPWTPKNFENIVSFYDRIHSDVYLVKASDDESQTCLVYNEMLDAFTSFFDYSAIPMMTNITDRFISYKNESLWLQNEGLYCNFFGQQYDYWMKYRVCPSPFSDKIWTNIEYRADFHRVLDERGNSVLSEHELMEDLEEKYYQPLETFDSITVWNEYQTTGEFKIRPEKKFRIWRYAIPRAVKTDRNIFGLDRIRNPWVNILFKKSMHEIENRDIMQAHDFVTYYFE